MVQYANTFQPDYIRQPGQNYILIAFANLKKKDNFAVKLRGSFATVEEAERVAKQFEEDGDILPMTIAHLYEFLPMPPDLSKIRDQRYTNDRLTAIMSGHDREERDAKIRFEHRKQALERDGLEQHLLPEERIEAPGQDVYEYLNIPPSLRPEDMNNHQVSFREN